MNIKLLFLFLILIISISILFYYSYNYEILNSYDVKNINLSYKNDVNNRNLETDKTKLILYWANWCGVCTKIKPNWEIAKNKIKNEYPDLEINEINCNDPTIEKCFIYKNGNKTNLDGVPTILIRKNNIDIEYVKNDEFKGDRSVNELFKFCENNLKNN